jgi:hypothetical protein
MTPYKRTPYLLQKAIAIKRRIVLESRICPSYVENSEIESERRVWRKCWPIGAISTTCTLVEPGST